jgi:hypothetical protein
MVAIMVDLPVPRQRAVEEVPALPRLAGALEELHVAPERVEVVHDLLLCWVHGQRVERRWVLEVDVVPYSVC